MSSNGTHVDFPHIDGEIDDLKALKFAHQLCTLVGASQSGWGGIHADADRTAASLKVLIETAEGFEASQIQRQQFMETMLRKDGLAVVIYLEANSVRTRLSELGHPFLADSLPDAAIGDKLQQILSTGGAGPQSLYDWTTDLENMAAEQLIAEDTGDKGDDE